MDFKHNKDITTLIVYCGIYDCALLQLISVLLSIYYGELKIPKFSLLVC